MKCFIFDIDGTLIDSAAVDQQALRRMLAEFGYHFTYEQLIFSFGMPGRRALAMLGIPADMYTAIFAMARLAGWCAHRMEELYGAGRIIRPAYNSIMGDGNYVPMSQR